MSVDDQVRRGLREAPPADPSGAYERIVEKKIRRRIVRRASRAALVVVVLAGSAAGFLGLASVFRRGPQPVGAVTGGRIAFTNFDPARAIGQVTGGWGIYTMDADGSDATFVSAAVDEALFPSFSPDGSQIAFVGFRDDPEVRGLFVTGADGTTRNILPIDDHRHQIDDVAWSPDGTRIGVVLTKLTPTEPAPDAGARDVESSTIWTIDPDGSDLTQVTVTGREGDLSWSPDGSRIVFSRYERVSEEEIRSDLYTVRVDGSEEERLTRDGGASSPAWSPDGRTIVYAGRGGPDGGYEDLYSVDAGGGDARRLTDDPGNEYEPAWSPDGAAIAYAERALDPGWSASTCFVSVMLADGTGRERIAGSPDSEGCPGQEGISWGLAFPRPTESNARPTAASSPMPSSAAGEDIGLAFNVCGVRTLQHIDFLGDGTEGMAWTGAPVNEAGKCTSKTTDTYIVAIDHTGDGVADDGWRTLEDCFMCEPYAAPDLDGDGDHELVVLESGGTTPRFGLFDVATGGRTRLHPIVVGREGTARDGFPSGEPVHLVAGGDEGFSGFVGCRNYPAHPEIFVGWADGPVDGLGSDSREVHFVRFIVGNGVARVLDTEGFSVKAGDPLPYPFGTDNVACGVDWNPY